MLCPNAEACRSQKKFIEWLIDDDDSEAQRRYLEDILLLSARLPGNGLNDAMIMYSEKTRRMSLESQNESQLNAAMNELIKQYELCNSTCGRKLGDA